MTREELTARLAECEGHTPGPFISDMGDITAVDSDGVNNGIIATVWGRLTPKTTNANIALFCLAPALASALREAWAEIDHLNRLRTDLEYAVAHRYDAWKNPLDEALNSGTGDYKP